MARTVRTIRKNKRDALNAMRQMRLSSAGGRLGLKPPTRALLAETRRKHTFTTVKKPYNHNSDPAKIALNHWYARDVMKFLGPTRQIILDSEHATTCKVLIEHGFTPDTIHAPNINKSHCAELRKLGVKSPHGSLEYHSENTPVRMLWYDSQTTPGGNASEYFYPDVVANNFLLNNRKEIGDRCLLAISIATRNCSKVN
jgi:hypothetical protein